MEAGDIVFLDKKKEIEGNVDNTYNLNRNTPYCIEKMMNDKLFLSGYGQSYHRDRFIIHTIDSGQINGVNIFKPGDKVKLHVRGMIGWEINDYTIGLFSENKIYTITEFHLTIGSEYVLLKDESRAYRGGYHPNHFKKI